MLPAAVVRRYGLSALGVGFMWNMLGFYYLKHATDVLLVPPAVMGALFGASRVWDAVTDPIVGHWSDRSRRRFGRRTWILASLVPLALLFVAVWLPPASLTSNALVAWLGVSICLFYTALTLFRVPHLALGAELARSHHERTRIFAAAKTAEALGALLLLPALYVLVSGRFDPLAATAGLVLPLAVLAPLIAWWALRTVREPRHLGSPPLPAISSYREVLRDRAARTLLVVMCLRTLGLVCLSTALPYACEYVLGSLSLMPIYLVAFCTAYVATMPVWTPLSRRYGKRSVFIAAGVVQGMGCVVFFFAPALPLALCCAALVGAMDGGLGTLGSSIGADITGRAGARTGERKEGTYFSVWSFGTKAAIGIAIGVVGVVLDIGGFVPGAEQSAGSQLAIRALLGAIPAALVFSAAAVMLRFPAEPALQTRRPRGSEIDSAGPISGLAEFPS